MDISWVSHGPGEADTGSNNGTARLVTIPSLRLGARYTATIMDLAAEDNLVSFAFSACKSFTSYIRSPQHTELIIIIRCSL